MRPVWHAYAQALPPNIAASCTPSPCHCSIETSLWNFSQGRCNALPVVPASTTCTDSIATVAAPTLCHSQSPLPCSATSLQLSNSLSFASKAQANITWLAVDHTEGAFVLAAGQDGSIQCFSLLVGFAPARTSG